TTRRRRRQLDPDQRAARPARLRREPSVEGRGALGERLQHDASSLGRTVVRDRERRATALGSAQLDVDAGGRSATNRLVDRLANDLVEAGLSVLAELVPDLDVHVDLDVASGGDTPR